MGSPVIESNPHLTIFTPTFNRADSLHRVYESLCAQTLSPDGFEWLVVDDGSTDGTKELVDRWRGSALFQIRYFWQENGGKHRAWNLAAANSRGELFIPFDSDDACVPDALEQIWNCWCSRGSDQPLAGAIALCNDARGRPIGPEFTLQTASVSELIFRHHLSDETWITLSTSVARQYQFPPGPRGRYLPETTIYHRISKDFAWLLLNRRLRVYYTDEDGRSDQISRTATAQSIASQAESMMLQNGSVLDNGFQYFRHSPRALTRAAVNYTRFAMHLGSLAPQLQVLQNPRARVLCWLVSPIAYVLFCADKRHLPLKDSPS